VIAANSPEQNKQPSGAQEKEQQELSSVASLFQCVKTPSRAGVAHTLAVGSWATMSLPGTHTPKMISAALTDAQPLPKKTFFNAL